jgi:hypothetical protein
MLGVDEGKVNAQWGIAIGGGKIRTPHKGPMGQSRCRRPLVILIDFQQRLDIMTDRATANGGFRDL